MDALGLPAEVGLLGGQAQAQLAVPSGDGVQGTAGVAHGAPADPRRAQQDEGVHQARRRRPGSLDGQQVGQAAQDRADGERRQQPARGQGPPPQQRAPGQQHPHGTCGPEHAGRGPRRAGQGGQPRRRHRGGQDEHDGHGDPARGRGARTPPHEQATRTQPGLDLAAGRGGHDERHDEDGDQERAGDGRGPVRQREGLGVGEEHRRRPQHQQGHGEQPLRRTAVQPPAQQPGDPGRHKQARGQVAQQRCGHRVAGQLGRQVDQRLARGPGQEHEHRRDDDRRAGGGPHEGAADGDRDGTTGTRCARAAGHRVEVVAASAVGSSVALREVSEGCHGQDARPARGPPVRGSATVGPNGLPRPTRPADARHAR